MYIFYLILRPLSCLLTFKVSQLLRETQGTLESGHKVAQVTAPSKLQGWGTGHTLHSQLCSHGSYFPFAEKSKDSSSCEHVLGSWAKLNTCSNFFFLSFQYLGSLYNGLAQGLASWPSGPSATSLPAPTACCLPQLGWLTSLRNDGLPPHPKIF